MPACECSSLDSSASTSGLFRRCSHPSAATAPLAHSICWRRFEGMAACVACGLGVCGFCDATRFQKVAGIPCQGSLISLDAIVVGVRQIHSFKGHRAEHIRLASHWLRAIIGVMVFVCNEIRVSMYIFRIPRLNGGASIVQFDCNPTRLGYALDLFVRQQLRHVYPDFHAACEALHFAQHL